MNTESNKNLYKGIDIKIPGVLNIFIFFLSGFISIFLLKSASDTNSYWIVLLCAIGFSFINNTLFSLLHEAVHKVFHSNEKLNYIFGVLVAGFFPTGFTFQRYCHFLPKIHVVTNQIPFYNNSNSCRILPNHQHVVE